MSSRKKPQNVPHLPDGVAVPAPLTPDRRTMFSAVAYDGERMLMGSDGPTMRRVQGELEKSQEDPDDLQLAFERARLWWPRHWFVKSVILHRLYFFTYGFAVKAEGASAKTKVAGWERNNRKLYRRYAREAWLEWLVQENVVGLWRKQGLRPPLVYPPESCRFSDVFGYEVLKIRHGLTPEHLKVTGAFSQAEAREFAASSELTLTHDNSLFDFDVLKRERTGSGLGYPALKPLFMCLAQMRSLEVGDAQLASQCRTVIEQHLMGHEIKSGIHAGSNAHFITNQRIKGFEQQMKGKTGALRCPTNFDHKIVQAANWPDPKVYDEKRYASALNRIALWSMPIGQMVLGKSLNPYLLPMFKQQAIGERDWVGQHLYTVFTKALGAPEEIKLVWSNRCFTDPRIAAELSKVALASGPLSQGTFLEEIGADQEEEWLRKEAESAKPKKLTTPIYDAAHGPPKRAPGRTPGTRDGEGE